MEQTKNTERAWVVTATMGYGHQRAVFPLKDLGEEGIISAGETPDTSKNEKKLWARVLGTYEFISRAKGIPLIGDPLFNLLDAFMHIPSFYPIRDLSNTTFQVNLLRSSIAKGLCAAMLEKIQGSDLPLLTSFYAPAIAADMAGYEKIYCIICDADLNRVWVAKEPWESKIIYFAPCGKAAQRLGAYGVPRERIFITGFPLPQELTGGEDLSVLKHNLYKRLLRLDPKKTFFHRQGRAVEHFLDGVVEPDQPQGKLTITYAVGGAGAQKDIGIRIVKSLKSKILSNEVKVILVAGIKANVRDYFIEETKNISTNPEQIEILYNPDLHAYFAEFNRALGSTDILWTKPSELSFYCGLGLPIIMTPSIGSQEKFNAKWLYEIQAGIRQENPDFADQWLFSLLKKGLLADAAWAGFLKARKLGNYKIREVLETGTIKQNTSTVLR